MLFKVHKPGGDDTGYYERYVVAASWAGAIEVLIQQGQYLPVGVAIELLSDCDPTTLQPEAKA